jgi:6-phosphogluconolactonase/glucosamine-6-phosphate isomerase/deaminase
MGKTKKGIRIIKKDSNKEDYTFVRDNILNNVNKIKNNPYATTNNDKIENKTNERIEKKIHSKKVDNKGRKILGKSLQGHSPIYE